MLENNQTKRFEAADVYRGFVMFLMMAEVLNLEKIAHNNLQSNFWQFLGWNQSHVEWVGCSLHDMIQPSFSLLVGLVLPFSIAHKVSLNIKFSSQVFTALKRSIILILLGVFLRSMHSESTNWTFEDTLSQIGLGYTFLYILGTVNSKVQWIVFSFVLLVYWLLFALFPLPDQNFNYVASGISPDWTHNLSGFASHWNKNTNAAWAFDQWFLNLFPRNKHFYFNGGGYTTLSFIPTLATMILGLIAGKILIAKSETTSKIKLFLNTSIALIFISIVLNHTGICPIVKRIWTPSWVLFSGGICFIFISLIYYLIEIKNIKKPFFWLKIIGMNSIVAYIIAHTIDGFIKKSIEIHFGKGIFDIFGAGNETLVSGSLILIVFWLILYWLYKKRIFIKI